MCLNKETQSNENRNNLPAVDCTAFIVAKVKKENDNASQYRKRDNYQNECKQDCIIILFLQL